MQERWRCIGYDHRGSGASTAPSDAITPQALVDDLFTVLDHYGVERCVLAGESLGALTCVLAVERDPSRFSGLILVDGGYTINMDNPLIAASRASFPGTMHGFVDRASSHTPTRIALQISRRSKSPRSSFMASSMPSFRRSWGEMAAKAIPDSKLVLIPGAGHVPTMTQPALW